MNIFTVPKAEKGFLPAVFYLREYFFPSGCGGCGRALLCPEDAVYGLCESCRALMIRAFNEEKRCVICGRILISEKNTCLSCRQSGSAEAGVYSEYLKRILALFPYTGIFKSALGAYKFEKSLGAGNFFARCFASALGGFEIDSLGESALVPVPPRPGKIKKQGWDQVEHLAKLLEREGRKNRPGVRGFQDNFFPVRRCLKRLPSRNQKELNREERSRNLKGRILCVKPPPKTAIVFDDVITTGATLNACAQALLESGAEKVYALCLFYD